MKHLTRSGDSCISKRGGGERESGRVGEWESGRVGEGEKKSAKICVICRK